jgi:hypothetical protein
LDGPLAFDLAPAGPPHLRTRWQTLADVSIDLPPAHLPRHLFGCRSEQSAFDTVGVIDTHEELSEGGAMAWLTTIPRQDARGELAEVYAEMAARPTPAVYVPDHGDAAGIIRAHSLDPQLMRRAFAVSGSLHRSTLDWADRELISSVTSRTNQCFY